MTLNKETINLIRQCESNDTVRNDLFWLLVQEHSELVMASFKKMHQTHTSPYLAGKSISHRDYESVMQDCTHNKVEGIKRVRAITGCGLKEAKDTIEYWMWEAGGMFREMLEASGYRR